MAKTIAYTDARWNIYTTQELVNEQQLIDWRRHQCSGCGEKLGMFPHRCKAAGGET